MPRPKRWNLTFDGHGIYSAQLSSWKYYGDLMREFAETWHSTSTVWRGQASAKWTLQSSIERELAAVGRNLSQAELDAQLARFKLAARGRRGVSGAPLQSDSDWWALGQHHGLATPLLDWTRSPWVALFFAFNSEKNENDSQRAVWGINRRNIEGLSAKLRAANRDAPIVEFVEPLADDNARLVNQGGLFTKAPGTVSLLDWVRQHIAADNSIGMLTKIVLPNRERSKCLLALDHMNINHVSLLPDLYGASKYCNASLRRP